MKKVCLILMLVVLQFGVFGQNAIAPAEGSGTSEDPWQIASLGNLYWILAIEDVVPTPPLSERLVANYIQTADINGSDTSGWILYEDFPNVKGWAVPQTFSGTYNGQDFVIDRLFFEYWNAEYIGLFSKTNNANLININLTNINFICGAYLGALVGESNNSVIRNCSTIGTAKTMSGMTNMDTYVGGLVGICNNTLVEDCFSRVNVSSSENVGGLIGSVVNNSEVWNCYSAGAVNYNNPTVGGLIGSCSNSQVLNSFWDIETTGKTVSAGGEGKTTAEMKTISTYTDAGWDFENLWNLESQINNGYPYLSAELPIISTKSVNDITLIKANCTVEILSLGVSPITKYGVCWNTKGNPLAELDSVLFVDSLITTGSFTFALSDLKENTSYFIRSFASNSETTVYGRELGFTTLYIDAVPPDGSGTEQDPYQIKNMSNLNWIAKNSFSWESNFIQTSDIYAELSSEMYDSKGWLPIGNDSICFSGTYNGKGKVISNLSIDRPNDDQGLFGIIENAELKNIGLNNVSINVYDRGSAGGVAGNSNYSIIEKCYSIGNVSGDSATGGLIGSCNNDTLKNCYSRADAVNGGLIGKSKISSINNCYSTGYISGIADQGGLIGLDSASTIVNSFWDIETSGQVTSQGGSGKTTYEMTTDSTFINSGWDFISAWEMTTDNSGYPILIKDSFDLPRLLFTSVYNITQNFATVTSQVLNTGGTEIIQHGFCWNTSGDPSISDNITENGYLSTTYFSDNLSDLELNTGYYIRSYAMNSSGIGYSNTIFFSTLPIYPITPNGSGTESNPYQIETLANLYWLNENSASWNKYFIQTTDIDATETSTWYPNGEGNYKGWGKNAISLTGNYNGQFHIIDNLHIYRPETDYVGFIKSGTVENLGLSNVEITGHNLVGGLGAYGDYQNCFVTGKVTGNNYVGGLCAMTAHLIEKCYSNTEVTGFSVVGGLVGWNQGTDEIYNCYSKGSVTGVETVGGLVGFHGNNDSFPVISKCFSTSVVNGNFYVGGLIGELDEGYIVGSSYWDIEVSGQISSNGGVGRTTAEMKTLSTFTDGGWDFVGESSNGTDDIWNIDGVTNNGYPYLVWQNDSTSINPDLSGIIDNYSLSQNYPNPFNPVTTISYSLIKNSQVNLKVFDIAGREVCSLVNQKQNKGSHEVKFDGSMLTSGIYFYRLSIDGKAVANKKMMLLK